MDYTLFAEFINRNKERDGKLALLADLGIDLYDFDEAYDFVFHQFLGAYWTEEGVEWIYWFMDESDYGERDWRNIDTVVQKTDSGKYEKVEDEFNDGYGAHDEDGNPVCYDVKSLYDYIKQYEKPVYEVIKNPIPNPKKSKK